ncbi:sensor histidine kinase [Desulfothermobacter acidiphilus]|uniref:sensor histidine kinase n=1 Tax=Desulfothermobacter acidiphilus TaxID=1938353 RepID=UPI003F8C3829
MQSIAVKLWLSMLLLISLVLGLLGLSQAQVIKWSYYRFETHRMVAEAEKLADLLAQDAPPQVLRDRVSFLNQMLQANVLVVNASGRVQHWWGTGRYFTKGMLVTGEDVNSVLAGQVVQREGSRPSLEGIRFLWVGVPIRTEQGISGGVFIYAPIAPLEARVKGLEMTLLLALLSGAMLAGMLSLFVARHFSRRLVIIEKVAKAMAAGNYAARAMVTGEDEVARLATSLNQLAAELEKHLKKLQRMDTARRDFVAAVSHELRTPLSIIQGYTEAILDGMTNPEETKQYLQAVHEEAERLKRLTDELLDLRRLETGVMELQRELVDLAEIAEQVASRFRRNQNHSFKVDIHPVPPIWGDADRLRQVVINLLDNAFRFTPPGGEVSLSLQPVDKGALLMVKDNGPGIPPEELPFIWEKFYRGDKSRTRSTGGSGLGLALVKQIVELHGGKVEAESQLGKGSFFRVFVPITSSGTEENRVGGSS